MQPQDPATDPEWDARLAGFPDASFFHTAAWSEVLRRTYGLRPAYFRDGDAHETRAVFPIMEVASWLTGRRGVSLPFSDRCSPLATGPAALDRVLAAAAGHGTTRSWRYLECRGTSGEVRGAAGSTTFHSHTLSLEGGEAALFAGCSAATRRAVRKAQRNYLQIEFSTDLASMQQFYRLHCATRRRHGLPPQPFRFFRHLLRLVLQADRGWLVLVSVNRVPAAGAIFFRFGPTVTYKFGASDPAFAHLRPNNLIMWEAIIRSARAGHRTFDFGRTSLENTGLRHFKLGWGAEERPLHYFRYQLPGARVISAPDRAHGWHNRLFRLLPPAMLRTLGAALYRHIA